MRFLRSVVLGALLLAAVSAGAASAQPRPAVIRIGGVEFTPQHVEYGPAGVGHVTIMWERLFNRRLRQKPIGHAQWVCTRLSRTDSDCTATFFLPRGKLVVAGAAGLNGAYELPVVGGTSLYEGARGTLSGQLTAARPRAETLIFEVLLQQP